MVVIGNTVLKHFFIFLDEKNMLDSFINLFSIQIMPRIYYIGDKIGVWLKSLTFRFLQKMRGICVLRDYPNTVMVGIITRASVSVSADVYLFPCIKV